MLHSVGMLHPVVILHGVVLKQQVVENFKQYDKIIVMREVDIRNEQVELARTRAKDLGVLKHSFMKGERNVVGFLGEILVAEYIKADIENTYDYDLVKRGIKIDVKSKRCTSIPQLHYECSVPAYNTRQKCDFYVFVRILEDYKKAWILGIIGKKSFFNKAILRKKGFTDTSNNMTFKEDSYNLAIKDLLDFKK